MWRGTVWAAKRSRRRNDLPQGVARGYSDEGRLHETAEKPTTKEGEEVRRSDKAAARRLAGRNGTRPPLQLRI